MQTEEESIPSEKYKEIEQGKVVKHPQKSRKHQVENNSLTPEDLRKEKRFNVYFFSSELVLLVLALTGFIITLINPDAFFYMTLPYEAYYMYGAVFAINLFICMFALLNTYLYIYKLSPDKRLFAYSIRLASIVLYTAIISRIQITLNESAYIAGEFYGYAVFLFVYGFVSQIILKTVLVTTDKKTKALLFNRSISASPAENEWKKYNLISGYLAVITGILMLQIFWFIYHFLIRPISLNKKKSQLILESLEFDTEINLSTLALELGITLEEVIYRLKKLQLKREIDGEFTRYGFILHEIRKAKWITPKINEKYERYLSRIERTEKEIHVSRFFDVIEREKMRTNDFKKVMKIKDSFSLDELVLYLPPNAIKIRKKLFSKNNTIIFNKEKIYMKRNQIMEILMKHYEDIFEE